MRAPVLVEFGLPGMSAHTRPSCAVSRNGNRRTPCVFGVRPDRIDHEVEFVGTVDLARYVIGHVGPDELGFGEVIEPVNALRVAILQQEHRIRRVFRPREQKQMIGAEVEHDESQSGDRKISAPLAAPLRG
jgi:hypothetical protein